MSNGHNTKITKIMNEFGCFLVCFFVFFKGIFSATIYLNLARIWAKIIGGPIAIMSGYVQAVLANTQTWKG